MPDAGMVVRTPLYEKGGWGRTENYREIRLVPIGSRITFTAPQTRPGGIAERHVDDAQFGSRLGRRAEDTALIAWQAMEDGAR